MMTSHIPKGSMCTSCSRGSSACAGLPFHSMQPIQRYQDGTTAVKCVNHQPTNATSPPVCLSCGARNHPLEDGSLPCGH